jgi:predicted nucleotidyltransferase
MARIVRPDALETEREGIVMIATLEDVARRLNEHNVRYIVIGGWAAIIHGAARSTNDVDIVYAGDAENLERLADALRPWSTYLRGAPPGLPFRWDAATIRGGLNFTLTTTHGDIDLIGEVAGGGFYEQLLPYSEEVVASGLSTRVVTLERPILLKRAAGRPKDFEALVELEALLEERKRSQSST